MYAIEVENARKEYGTVTALDGLTLQVERGETVGLLGTNGAGKTTLFELLVGLRKADSGSVKVLDRDPTDGVTTRQRVGYLPEHAGFPDELTGREVLRFHARMRGVDAEHRDHRIARVLETVGLTDAADRRVAGYSNGMARRLGLGTVLVADPAILLLDEPTAGLDPYGVEAFHDVLGAIASTADVTVVFSSHVLDEVETLCDRAAVVHDGRVVVDGGVDALRRQTDENVTVHATLGSDGDADSAAERLRSRDDVEYVTEDDTELIVECISTRAFAVLDELHESVDVERFTVRDPGLESAFRAAVAERRANA
ncbi:ABC transporter ATP-binding protein [Haloarcula amylovorans]|uniref:ABC transporter ATP-binding protein n=1 Tax=Haloarcula amylovorans TaxID=2562280 RepID=UPI0010762D0B|nr:ABC transporter ATP-binding protein [Halomicroarcula amylolytica]